VEEGLSLSAIKVIIIKKKDEKHGVTEKKNVKGQKMT